MASKSQERREKVQSEEKLRTFSYPTLGGAVIKAASQEEADKIAAKLSKDLKAQEAASNKDADKSESEE